MCELQWVGNEEKRASSSVHVQPHWNSHLCNPLCFDPRRVHFHWKVHIYIHKWGFAKILLQTQSLALMVNSVRCSLCGMCLMFTGLYFVLWAKGKEGFAVAEILEPENDVDKPLLG